MSAATKTRVDGDGSIHLRADGRWCGVVSLGVDSNGKRQRRYVYGDTRDEARGKLIELQAAALRGELKPTRTSPAPAPLTVGELLDRWLKLKRSGGDLAPTTYVNYERTVRLHLKPPLGSIPVRDLGAEDVAAVLGEKLGEGLSGSTRRQVYDRLCAALDWAVEEGHLTRNVARSRSVKRPRVRHELPETFAPDEAGAILDVLWEACTGRVVTPYWPGRRPAGERRPDRRPYEHVPSWTLYAPVFLLAAYTGLRQGELLALKWSAVDLKAGTVTVAETLRRDGTFADPKSDAGARCVPIEEPEVVAVLRRLRAERLVGPGLVFCTTAGHTRPGGRPIGSPLVARAVSRHWHRVQEHAAIPEDRRRGTHALRKLYASALLAGGATVPEAQRLLGHSSASVTLDIYASASTEGLRKAAAGVAAVYGAARSTG